MEFKNELNQIKNHCLNFIGVPLQIITKENT